MTQKNHEVVVVSQLGHRGKRGGEYYEAEIDKDRTPIPSPVSRHNYKYPLDTMEIGESFTVPFSKTNRELVSQRVAHFQTTCTKKFATRSIKEEKSTRIWRIE